MRHAKLGQPVALGEEAGQNITERALLVEEADAANADRMVAFGGKAGHNVWRIEDEGLLSGGLTPGEARGEQARMPPWCDRRWQEARKEGMMRSIGEVARRMARLPAGCG